MKCFLRGHDLRFAGLGGDRYLCSEDDRVTIVAPVRIDGIEAFLTFIEPLVHRYPRPLVHATLLKSGTAEHGISANSLEDLGRFGTKLPLSNRTVRPSG